KTKTARTPRGRGGRRRLGDRRYQARTPACRYVFTRGDGRRCGRFVKAWKAAAAAVGRPDMILHDFRRSGARTLIRQGVPESVVMRLGGWRTRSMLDRYDVTSMRDLVDAQAKLDAALATATPRVVAL